MIKKLLKIFFFLTLMIIPSHYVMAATDTLPEILSGELEMCTMPFPGPDTNCSKALGSEYFYGGQRGNSAVFNYETSQDYGFLYDRVTADPSSAGLADADCTLEELLITHPTSCFALGRGQNGQTDAGSNRLLVGRATLSADGEEITASEVPALYMSNLLVGDAKLPDYSNFQFWGRQLAQSGGAAANSADGATWRVPSYTINPDAQATWDQTQFNQNIAKINALKGEAQRVDAADSNSFNLDFSVDLQSPDSVVSLSGIPPTDSEREKYPEGKIWIVKKTSGDNRRNLDINGNNTYSGRGTIIVNGDVTFHQGASFTKVDDTAALGLIVYGSVTFEGNNNFDGAVFAYDDPNGGATAGIITLGSNIGNLDLTGSYVASSFTIPPANYNIRIVYDYNFDRSWPPGFRYLSMPHPRVAGNADN